MGNIRLLELVKRYEISLNGLVGFLRLQGYHIDEDPNVKVDDKAALICEKAYSDGSIYAEISKDDFDVFCTLADRLGYVLHSLAYCSDDLEDWIDKWNQARKPEGDGYFARKSKYLFDTFSFYLSNYDDLFESEISDEERYHCLSRLRVLALLCWDIGEYELGIEYPTSDLAELKSQWAECPQITKYSRFSHKEYNTYEFLCHASSECRNFLYMPVSQSQAQDLEEEDDEYETVELKIISIDKQCRVFTEGFGDYQVGVLFPENITSDGQPVSFAWIFQWMNSAFKVGETYEFDLIKTKSVNGIGILTYDLGVLNESTTSMFESMRSGSSYLVYTDSETPNYFIVGFKDYPFLGVVAKNAIDIDKDINEDGFMNLSLLEKGQNPLDLLAFVKPELATDSYETQDPEALFNNFFKEEEREIIDEKDRELVKMMLKRHPDMQRDTSDQVTGAELFCRVPEDSQLPVFLKSHPGFLDGRAFWINYYNQHGEDIIYLFHEKVIGEPSIVVEIKALDGNQFYVSNSDTGNGWEARRIIKNINKRTCLKIDASHIHFLGRYDSIPASYDTTEVIDYLAKLTDFNKRILSDIEIGIELRTNASAHDYKALGKYLRYQIGQESAVEDNDIFIAPSRISSGSSGFTTGDSSLRLELTPDDLDSLLLENEEFPDRLHVSIVNEMGEELLNGYLTTDGIYSYLHFNGQNIDSSKFFEEGIYLHRRASVKHLKIQAGKLDNFINDELYQDLVFDNIEPTEEHKYDDIQFFNPVFNLSSGDNNQASAVKKALGLKDNSIALIQGPPGTGKTTIIVEIIEQLVKEGKHVLVCSQAHAAVDNIEGRLRSRHPSGMSLLNISEDEGLEHTSYGEAAYSLFLDNNMKLLASIKDNGADSTIVSSMIESFLYQTKDITKSFREKHRHIATYYSEVKDQVSIEQMLSILNTLKSESGDLTNIMIQNQYYCEQDVIFGTCIGVGTDYVMSQGGVHFDTVIIDEAGKANLAETIVPMTLGNRFVLVGDHKQLPPYIDRKEIEDYSVEQIRKQVSKEADDEDSDSDYTEEELKNRCKAFTSDTITALSTSLFSDFFNHENFPEENKVTLNYQFRMHPDIGQYISELFYEGVLQSGTGTEKQTVEMPDFPNAVTFVDTTTPPRDFTYNPAESRSNDNSYFNKMEEDIIAENIIPALETVIDANPDLSVGIITPYKGQCRNLRDRLSGTRFERDVFTIDSIQGSEFDIVVFSFVRSFSRRSNKKVGFLDDLRRLNVSLSRAKKKLILVGNLHTLQNPDAHDDFGIQGMAEPTDVFLKISRNIKRYFNLSDYDKFRDADPEKGRVFAGCICSKNGSHPTVSIHLDGDELTFNLAENALDLEDDVSLLDVVFTGYSKHGKPHFDLTYFEEFAATHKENESVIGVVHSFFKGKKGNVMPLIRIGKAEAVLICREDKHIGDSVNVRIREINPELRRIYCVESSPMADRMFTSPKMMQAFNAVLIGKKDFPIVTMQFPDGSSGDIDFPDLSMTGLEGNSYKFVKWANGNFSLDKCYYEAFVINHKIHRVYSGEVVAEDERLYYVDVDGFCGTIYKPYMDDSRSLAIGQLCKVEYSSFDEKTKKVKFKLA